VRDASDQADHPSITPERNSSWLEASHDGQTGNGARYRNETGHGAQGSRPRRKAWASRRRCATGATSAQGRTVSGLADPSATGETTLCTGLKNSPIIHRPAI